MVSPQESPGSPSPSVAAWYEETLCSSCKAGCLLHWYRESGISLGSGDWPQHAVVVEDHWAAVHCDYFRRRVELPDQLSFCGAQRAK